MKSSFPLRPQLYLPVDRYGVILGDWPFVLGATTATVVIPLVSEISIKGVPVAFPAGAFVFFILVIFFNWVRRNRRPGWTGHVVRAAIRPRRTGRSRYGPLPPIIIHKEAKNERIS
jgi:hypothetical protein